MVSAQRGFSPGNPVFSAPLKSCPKSYSIPCWRDLGGPHTGRDVSPGRGGGGGLLQYSGMIEWGKNQNPKISMGLPTKPPKNPWVKS